MSERPDENHHFGPRRALRRLRDAGGDSWRTMLERGACEVGIYAPRDHDPQQPHRRDEIYVVIAGQGFFRNGEHCHAFGPGDLMYVPAGVDHRFEDFTDDFAAWVIFLGHGEGE